MFTSKIKNAAAALLLGVGALSFSLSAQAAEEKPSILVVDVQSIFEKSTAVVKVREQIDKKAEEFRKDSASKEDYFKKKFDELEKQKSVLAKDAFEKKNADLSKEFADAQKKVQDNRSTLDKGYMDSMQQVETTLTDIVKEVATKKGVKVVLPKNQIIYSDDSLDVTNQVLEDLNKKLPNITVKF